MTLDGVKPQVDSSHVDAPEKPSDVLVTQIDALKDQLNLSQKVMEEVQAELDGLKQEISGAETETPDPDKETDKGAEKDFLNADGTVDLAKVDAFLTTIKDQEWSDLKAEKRDRSWITAVQIKLASLGYALGAKKVDGWFGRDTKAAVKKFQENNGLAVDGFPGKETLAKLLDPNSKKEEISEDGEGKGKKSDSFSRESSKLSDMQENWQVQLKLQATNQENRYTREGYNGLYCFGEDNKLYYAGADHGAKVFLGTKATNWESINPTELPSLAFRKDALIYALNLQAVDGKENKYTRKGYDGSYAFDKQGDLYYAGLDYPAQKFIGLSQDTKTDSRRKGKPVKEWRPIPSLPDEVKHISVGEKKA